MAASIPGRIHRRSSTIRYVGRELQRPECILAEPTARCGPPTRAAASPASRRRLAAPSASADTRFGDGAGDAGAAVSPLHARHAAQRPGLHRRRQHPDLQLRHRPAGNHGPRRAHPHADRQHRRPAHRQGQLRAARYQGPRLAHRLDAGEPMDGRLPTACATAMWRWSKMAASAWWPTDFTSPTKSGSTPASNGCTSWKPPARASPACGWTSPGQAKSGWSTAKSSAPPTWAACPTASRSTRTAICGPR